MVLITYSREPDHKRSNGGNIAHLKPFWVVIICALFIVGYIVYPRGVGPDDADEDPSLPVDTVTDIDGNVYETVRIGDQVWMVENLRTTRLNDGQIIPYEPDDLDWANLRAPGYCWSNNDLENKDDLGALYNWYAVNTGKLAPIGWHVPTEDEWKILSDTLGGESVAGDKLKEIGFTTCWAGQRTDDGTFNCFELEKYWTASEGGWHPADAYYRIITKIESELTRSSHPKMAGHSVRCVKNN